MQFDIVGVGMGTVCTLTEEARNALQRADVVFSTARIAKGIESLCQHLEICTWDTLFTKASTAHASQIAILVSGDTGFFSVAKSLQTKLASYGEVSLHCGISSMQYFCAKIGTSYDDVSFCSLHGRDGSLVGSVCYHPKVFALTGGKQGVQAICQELTQAGLAHVFITVGECLGSDAERIIQGTASTLQHESFDSLSVMLIQNPQAVNPHIPIRDVDLIRGKTPMTKEEIRWISVQKLAVQPNDVIWDVGAGTGSVTIELARRAYHGTVYAIERSPEALSLIEQNRKKLGAFNIVQIEGSAPDALGDLPAPDGVFIGGSGGSLAQIIQIILQKNPKARIVLNAITLETLQEALEICKNMQLSVETVQVSVSRGKAVGPYTMMMANNPVFILSMEGSHAGEHS